jgi:hypothetical protein
MFFASFIGIFWTGSGKEGGVGSLADFNGDTAEGTGGGLVICAFCGVIDLGGVRIGERGWGLDVSSCAR